ncbi:uncharacterized protein LOC143446352 [Clavelina lepadiformis]|uniref:uncharacterized protein LOC143446352 n=1 Tax=Clavelina lepadiformis TaxID=159417 RepID=UPI0040419E97
MMTFWMMIGIVMVHTSACFQGEALSLSGQSKMSDKEAVENGQGDDVNNKLFKLLLNDGDELEQEELKQLENELIFHRNLNERWDDMDSLQNLINQALSGGITNDANDISSDIFNTNNKRGEMDFPLIIKRPSSDGGEENSFEETLRRQQSRSGIGRYVPSIKKEHMLEPPILQRMSFPYVIKKTKFLPALLKRIYQLQ